MKLSYKLLLLFVAALALRASVALLLPFPSRDAITYCTIAQDMATGNPAGAVKLGEKRIPPLMPLTMAAGTKLGVPVFLTGTMLASLAGALVPILAFLIARKLLKDERLAWAAAILLTLLPSAVEQSANAMRDQSYVALMLGVVLAGIKVYDSRSWSKRWLMALMAGILTGLALTVRREAVELLLFFSLAPLAAVLFKPRTWRCAAVLPGFWLATVLIVSLVIRWYSAYSPTPLKFVWDKRPGKFIEKVMGDQDV
ncbi:MAG: glycosyltransferase family 39 protein [Victivallaceae bacterium]|nr:glycosyltransferase family 39 protein [Victivallaceae bacterium]